MTRRAASSPSIISIASSSSEAFSPSDSDSPPAKKRKNGKVTKRVHASSKTSSSAKGKGKASGVVEIEEIAGPAGPSIRRPHGRSYHAVDSVVEMQEGLLAWFEDVREKRGMPWRKRYDPDLSDEEKGQRAYEIWGGLLYNRDSPGGVLMEVSEVMLQQTQVSTVIAYWKRWIEKWPTIADLAKADIEEVNAAWRYYRRARSLLEGAKTVMSSPKYQGRLPSDPAVLEKEISGVGKYTAGAITSMAYGVRASLVDGNVHRLFTRLLAVHAPQTAPSTIKFLWNAADELVESLPHRQGIAGNWNQALMELGSQICKPVSPDCAACPMKKGCKAYQELSSPPPAPESASCDLCVPIPSSKGSAADRIPSIMVFPMRKEKKTSREEQEVVCITEWSDGEGKRRWLFTKRPEKGLFQPPTVPLDDSSTAVTRKEASLDFLAQLLDLSNADLEKQVMSHKEYKPVQHIFSHINMTYHVHHLVLSSDTLPPASRSAEEGGGIWLSAEEVEGANVGTGVKKVWAEVFGSWGAFERGKLVAEKKKIRPGKRSIGKAEEKDPVLEGDEAKKKVKKTIMMPLMPSRKATAGE